MNTLRTLIADDEYLAVEVLKQYASQFKSLSVEATFTNPIEALHYLEKSEIDLLFLDIQMPMLNGFELLQRLRVKPIVILTTARHDYATQAYDLDVLDYLVKPIPFERFERAVNKASDYHAYLRASTNVSRAKTFLMIRADHKIVKIEYDSIIYLEAWGEYVKVHCNDKTHVTLNSLKSLVDELPTDQFLRVHKSYVVSLRSIVSYTHLEINLVKDIVIPFGRTYRKDVDPKLKGIDK